jgi:hypothetical protein
LASDPEIAAVSALVSAPLPESLLEIAATSVPFSIVAPFVSELALETTETALEI